MSEPEKPTNVLPTNELLSVEDVIKMTRLPEVEIVEAMRHGRLGFDIIDGDFVVTALDLFDWIGRNDRAAHAFKDSPLKPYDLLHTPSRAELEAVQEAAARRQEAEL